ncbi:DUF2956 domain-containing protein [Agarivorans sp.]|uniref:DUF2956 domain-containing protein n=1 Tax=Agarivorans sp. TaxID=1872412 RepID=UPI003CFFE8E4
MAKATKSKPSEETIASADALAKANQRPGQTKEQTKLISAGIQKGIEQYKKQQKAKQREADKLRKKQRQPAQTEPLSLAPEASPKVPYLPWVLLVLSWLGFVTYLFSY